MKSRKSLYHRHRFPREIIRHAVWLYYRFCLSYRDVEDLLSERGIKVSYETIRRWCTRFGPTYANRLRKKAGCGGDQWFVDEVFVRIDGELRYLYRAVDQDGQVLDILVQTLRNTKAAARFFRRLLKQQGQAPRRLMSDKLRSYAPAHREVMPGTIHDTRQHANNRAELSHEPTRQRERRMRRFESSGHAQLFLSVHGAIQNLFAIPRHLLRAKHHRAFRAGAFDLYEQVTCA
jgi:putative transposase